jgi:hypothetical protein
VKDGQVLRFMNGMLVTYTGGNFTPAGHCTADLVAVVEAQPTCTDAAAQSGAGLGHLMKHIFFMIALTDPLAIRSAFPDLVPLQSVQPIYFHVILFVRLRIDIRCPVDTVSR